MASVWGVAPRGQFHHSKLLEERVPCCRNGCKEVIGEMATTAKRSMPSDRQASLYCSQAPPRPIGSAHAHVLYSILVPHRWIIRPTTTPCWCFCAFSLLLLTCCGGRQENRQFSSIRRVLARKTWPVYFLEQKIVCIGVQKVHLKCKRRRCC